MEGYDKYKENLMSVADNKLLNIRKQKRRREEGYKQARNAVESKKRGYLRVFLSELFIFKRGYL